MNHPRAVTVVEVGPRDGLQNETVTLSAADKVRFIEMLADAELPVVEATSFVSPKWVPQLADAAEVFPAIRRRDNTRYPALVPNPKGLERAVEAGVTEFAFFTAASETFNQKNINLSVAESLSLIREMMQTVAGRWRRAYVSTAIYCPYEGRIQPQAVEPIVKQLFAMGADEVSVGDTIGWATPGEVMELTKAIGTDRIAYHFHDTRGAALANVLAAMDCGVSTFDSSAGGLGGCPFAPGAAGNLATEDLVYLLNGLGVQTGVDIAKVVAASRFVEGKLGHPLPSKYLRACSP